MQNARKIEKIQERNARKNETQGKTKEQRQKQSKNTRNK